MTSASHTFKDSISTVRTVSVSGPSGSGSPKHREIRDNC